MLQPAFSYRLKIGLVAAALSCVATTKTPPPAPHAAPPRAGGGGAPRMGGGAAGGGVHMPGSMGGGGAHMPGNMSGAGGAHVPSSMGGGAGGAHLPGSMAGNAHMPSSMSRGDAHVPGGTHLATRSATPRASAAPGQHESTHAATATAHRDAGTAHAATGQHDTRTAHAGQPDHADPRIGGGAAHNTRTAQDTRQAPDARQARDARGADAHAADRALHDPRHPPEHRDAGADRAFAARHEGDFHTRRVRDFTPRELAAWRGGGWSDGWHYGRFGWWWDVDGVWYGYPDPVFPYPTEVALLTVYDTPQVDVALPPDLPAIAPLPAPAAGRYACASPSGYYPDVGACGAAWDFQPAPGTETPL